MSAEGSGVPGSSASTVHWFAADDPAGLSEQLAAAQAGDGPATVGPPTDGGPARLVIVDPTDRTYDLAQRLVAKRQPWHGRSDIWFSPNGLALDGGRVAFLFPGVEPTFGAGATNLAELAGIIGIDAPDVGEATLGRRSAAIIRLGMFLDDVLRRCGVAPEVVLGHSLGEWSGTIASGMVPASSADDLISALDLDVLDLPDVEFIALGCGAAQARSLLVSHPDVVVSHDNCPRQSILCAPRAQVGAVLATMRDANVMGYALEIKSGFHTPALTPLLPVFRDHIDALPFVAASVPLWSATTVEPYPTDPAGIRELHLRHLVEPLRFRELVTRLYEDEGVRIFVQPGIGAPIGFVSDTLGNADHLAIAALNPKRSAVEQVRRTLAALWVEGVAVDPRRLDRPVEPVAPATVVTEAVVPSRGPVIELPADPAPAVIRPEFARAAAAVDDGVRIQLDAGTHAHPVIAEATALLAESAASTFEILAAWEHAQRHPVVTRNRRGARGRLGSAADLGARIPAAVTTSTSTSTSSVAAPAAFAPAPVAEPVVVAPAPSPRRVDVRRLSLEDMPEVWDHCLFRQPEGWPVPEDWFPVVAFTSQLPLYAEVAEARLPGQVTVGLSKVKVMRWLDIPEPVDLPIETVVVSDDEVRVSFLPFGRGNVHLADRYPSAGPAMRVALRNPRPTRLTAQELFTENVMFHGPRFQGIRTLGPIGDDGIVGELEGMADPGALLDNVGKFIAYWVMEERRLGENSFPIGIDRVDWFGPEPPPGEKVDIDVRIVELTADRVKADCTLTYANGDLFCQIQGWAAHIFHADDRVSPAMRFPDTCLVGEAHPDGPVLVREGWPSGAARELMSRRYLSTSERAVMEAHNLRDQRGWLLERIAAKDAVRHWLVARGITSYPIEIEVVDTPSGGVVVRSPLIDGHDLRVAVAHVEWVAVAVLADGKDPRIQLVEIGTDSPVDDAAFEHTLAFDPDDVVSLTDHPLVARWSRS